MTTPKLVIRCLTDESKGYGHLNRCLTLADELRNNKQESIFIINSNPHALKEIKEKKFRYKIIPNFYSNKNESSYVKKIVETFDIKAVIIDMREYGEQLSKHFSNNDFQTILIDDGWVKKVYSDIIINGTIVKKYHEYKKIKRNSKFFLDTKYFIANKEFLNHKKKLSRIKDKRNYLITISMGGSDPKGITVNILKYLQMIPSVQINIIIGPFFKKFSILKKKYDNVKIIKNPKKIWLEFQKSDLVISNSGSTLYELAIMGIPTLCITTFEHERPYANEFSKRNFSIKLGNWEKIDSYNFIKNVTNVLRNKKKRKIMSISGPKIIDGKGISRVTSEVIKCLEKTNENL